MFDGCVETNFIPKVIVLCGNFTSRSLSQGSGRDIQRYQGACDFGMVSCFFYVRSLENFDSLADLVASYPLITRNAHFVLIPGPLDYTMNATLPRRPLLSSFVARLKSKLPKVHFATNPCRIKFFGQEIVVFREDAMARMLRNVIGVKKETKSEDLKRFVCPCPLHF
jgi:DNA polymerase epsilon subunit 2